MKNNKGIDFLSFFINLLIATILAAIAIFVYFCVNYGVEDTITEFTETFNVSKIITPENQISIELPTVENPLSSAEIVGTSKVKEEKNEEGYYYKQIDDNAKIIYNALLENEEKLRTGNYKIDFKTQFNELLNKENGSQILNDSYQQALDALSLDKPQIFYLDISKMLLMIYSRKTIFKTTYNVSIESEENDTYFSEGFNSEEEINTAISQIESVREDLYNQLGDNVYDKVKEIHDCLVNSLEYEKSISKSNIRNIYGALVSREVVCEGYAKAFKYILDGLDIPNIIVVGVATNSNEQTESHAWNYVYIDEKWYAIDVTWDDPIMIGGGKLPSKERYKYFLKGSELFEQNHIATGMVSDKGKKFLYPELSVLDYE